ncbi:probable ATP-dependent RNA helicase DHX35 isoform X2 [Uloborus diversus]|uniref:probable ATP-dependent RNA helicase DHX35 isoform X2 n=1 Tax=Uloborus diversus TaxID=327109 RepID=UPI00240939EA|nr:probable ATP-dependent RNA helicase DHX35 isoform X2 [Uloborus diversus]
MTFKPKFLKPGDLSFDVFEERKDPYESDQPVAYNPDSLLSYEQQRQKLPIFKYRNHILYLLEHYQTVIVLGETGCGKSTQIPQYLLETGWAEQNAVIGVTQPRRVAATMLASRVAEEKGTLLGRLVGYSIRFEDCFNPKETKIKYMTEGMLINEMMADPLLRSYSVLMLDEIHERSLTADILLGLLKKVIKKRQDLKLIISSATFEAETVFKFFNKNESQDKTKDTAVIISVEGRNYPVDVHYSKEPVADYLKASVDTVSKIHLNEPPGDVLVFLTGQEEVDFVTSKLIDFARDLKTKKDVMKLFVVPLYGALPMSEQLRALKPASRSVRKIVVSTNIAEASLTINGIAYIVDCCFVKLRCFNPHSCTDSLVVVPVSRASAEQRAGRAGRLRSGKAFRLCTDDFLKLPAFTVPEMQRSNLASVILQLKALGIENILRFSFPSAPPSKHVITAIELLYALGAFLPPALDEEGGLTSPLGTQMAEFPLHPMFSKMILISGEFGCTEEILTITAMLQVQNVFVASHGRKLEAKRSKWKFAVEEGDLFTLLNIYNAFLKNNNKHWCGQNSLNYKGLLRAMEIRMQLSKLLKKFKVPNVPQKGDEDSLRKCIVSAFFANAAFLHYTGVYKTVRGEHELHIHPDSVLLLTKQPKWVVFIEVLHTTKEYMRDVTVIEPSWLYELAPHYYQYGTDREIASKRLSKDK